MLRLDCGFTPTSGLVVVLQCKVRHREHKAGKSDPSTSVIPWAQSQRELGVRFCLVPQTRGRLGER